MASYEMPIGRGLGARILPTQTGENCLGSKAFGIVTSFATRPSRIVV